MYDHIAPSYNALHGEEQQRKLNTLCALCSLPDGAVLDVGCGTAHLAAFFDGREYIGVDPSQPLLDQAPQGVKTICCSGEELPFEDNSFPVVLSLTALHNYSDWRAGIDELFRVCKDTLLVGVLKKSSEHDEIVSYLKEVFVVACEQDDLHDTLFVLTK